MRVLIRDLAPNQTYGVKFRLVGNGQLSEWSTISRFTTASDLLAPANVTGLTVATVGTAFKVTWNKVTTNTDGSTLGDFKDYQVSVTANNVTRTWYVTGESFDLPIEVNTNAFGTPQGAISVSVSARDNTLNIADNAPSVSGTNAAPPAPANFAARPFINGANFTWDKVAISDLKYYRIYVGTSTGAINNLIYEGPSNNFTWSSVDFTTNYYFKVAAVDVFNQETLSSHVTATALSYDAGDVAPPDAPTWPVSWFASETDLSNRYNAVANVTLTWNANSETDLASYVVRYKKASDSVWAQTRVSGTATTPPVATVKIYGLAANVAYNFELSAVDKTGNASAFVAAPGNGTTTRDTTAPDVPSAPVISSYRGLVNVEWNGLNSAGTAMSSDASNIEVHVSQTTGFTVSSATLESIMNATAGPNKTLLADLPYDVPHFIKFVAVDFSGNRSGASAQATATATRLVDTDVDISAIGDAQDTADSALQAANGKNKITFSLSDAPTTGLTGYVTGDTWFKKNASNQIVGQWEFTGGAFVSKTIDNAMIAATLDAGKITVGTLNALRIGAGTISAEKLTIASQAEDLILNGSFSDLDPSNSMPVLWTRETGTGFAGATYATSTTAADVAAGARSFRLNSAANSGARIYTTNMIPAAAGRKMVAQAYIKGAAAYTGNSVAIRVLTYNSSGSALAVQDAYIGPATAAYALYAGVVTLPTNTTQVRIAVDIITNAAARTIWVSQVEARYTVTGTIIEDGAITTNKMTANSINGDRIQAQTLTVGKIATGEIAAGQRIIAGVQTGPHAEMTSDGFRTYSVDANGLVYEVTKMGTSSDDTLTITDSTGVIKAAMDTTGKVVGRGLTINGPAAFSEWPTVAGKSLLTSITERPRGLMVWGAVDGGNVQTVAERGDAAWSFWADPGRMYQVSLGPIQVLSTVSGDFVQCALRYTVNGSDPTPSSPFITYGIAQHNNTLQMNSLFQVSGTPGTLVPIKLLLTHARNFGSGSAYIQPAGGYLAVTDIGATLPASTLVGTTAPSSPSQTYTTDFAPTWWHVYRGDNSLFDSGNDLYQGYESTNGNMKSMVGFQDMTPWISGSTVNAMWLYVYAEHWWNASGGNPVIGAHPNLSDTFVWPGGANSQYTESAMARGEGRWIQLPSTWYGGFAGGSNRGIVFGPGWDNGSMYYGRFDGPSLRIRVNYTK